MYLKITSKCNMTCEHCCMNCYADGEDMSMETVRQALEIFEGHIITIGGGEPTIHPKFWEIFGEVMAQDHMEMHPYIVTNGSMTTIAKALANMARAGVIGAALSQDDYHDPIEWEVIEAFTRDKSRSFMEDCREIRNVSGNEINAGRCNFGKDDACPCNDFIVQPNGDVKLCGCDDAPTVGNVHDGFNPCEWEFDMDHCYRYAEEKAYA